MNKVKFILSTAILALAIAFTLSCSKDDDLPCVSCEGGDPSGGGSCNASDYGTQPIGTQVWMAENLNCNVSGSKCYDNKQANCDKYGRLYNWEAAKKACPSGWHLPSKEEWDELASYIESDKGCTSCDAKHLKSKSGWNEGGNGLDSYSFSALPGGFGTSDGGFGNAGYYGYWWSASEHYSNNAYGRGMHYYDEGAYWYNLVKDNLFSVRCLQD